ncbi:MAG: FAD:protein FMN transferase [Pseudomonadales bacterium]|nr:FAD:protein FMN transferase [Pseudomonadales bacterium]
MAEKQVVIMIRQFLRVTLFICLVYTGPAAAEWYQRSEAIMGTRVHAEIWHEEAAQGEAALDAVMAEMHRVDALMSPYKAESELSRLNNNAFEHPFVVSEEMFRLLQKSQRISLMTEGAFDITYASAGRFYDYRNAGRPQDKQLSEAVMAIDYRHVIFDPENSAISFALQAVSIDLGGIAKGYAVDRCIEILMALGIDQAMVSAGGDSRIIGDHRGKPWSVGIKDPRNPDAMVAVLPLENTALSTSGDYERFFIEDGVRYHHIINPETGRSSSASRSVTIIGNEATFTDALSTSVFVMGLEKGLDLINRLPGIDAIIINNDGKLHFSDDLLQLAH